MDSLKLYIADTDYVKYLQKFDKNVKNNEKNGRLRPYCGVIINVNEISYYIPLCSPKDKHKTMKDTIDFIRIDFDGELKSVLNISSMIPIHDEEIQLMDFNAQEPSYRKLLINEFITIRKKKTIIINNANILYKKITEHRGENPKLEDRCCNFLLLEQKMREYVVSKQIKAAEEQIAADKQS